MKKVMKKVFVFKLTDDGSEKVAEFYTLAAANKFIEDKAIPEDYYTLPLEYYYT